MEKIARNLLEIAYVHFTEHLRMEWRGEIKWRQKMLIYNF